jgi:hypothetical protein
VKLGKIMWKAIVNANCRRDSSKASKCMGLVLRLPADRRRAAPRTYNARLSP